MINAWEGDDYGYEKYLYSPAPGFMRLSGCLFWSRATQRNRAACGYTNQATAYRLRYPASSHSYIELANP